MKRFQLEVNTQELRRGEVDSFADAYSKSLCFGLVEQSVYWQREILGDAAPSAMRAAAAARRLNAILEQAMLPAGDVPSDAPWPRAAALHAAGVVGNGPAVADESAHAAAAKQGAGADYVVLAPACPYVVRKVKHSATEVRAVRSCGWAALAVRGMLAAEELPRVYHAVRELARRAEEAAL